MFDLGLLYNPAPRYHFSHGFVYASVDCPECKEPLKFQVSWKEVMDGIDKNITELHGECYCHATIAFNLSKEALQGFTAESVLEAFEEL